MGIVSEDGIGFYAEKGVNPPSAFTADASGVRRPGRRTSAERAHAVILKRAFRDRKNIRSSAGRKPRFVRREYGIAALENQLFHLRHVPAGWQFRFPPALPTPAARFDEIRLVS